MKKCVIMNIAGLSLFIGACSTGFVLSKGGYHTYLGSNSNIKYNMLCSSGELEKVLATTHLSQERKDTFYRYNCSDERSSEKIKQLYAAMTPEERKDMKKAFKANGYGINQGRGCCAVNYN